MRFRCQRSSLSILALECASNAGSTSSQYSWPKLRYHWMVSLYVGENKLVSRQINWLLYDRIRTRPSFQVTFWAQPSFSSLEQSTKYLRSLNARSATCSSDSDAFTCISLQISCYRDQSCAISTVKALPRPRSRPIALHGHQYCIHFGFCPCEAHSQKRRQHHGRACSFEEQYQSHGSGSSVVCATDEWILV